MLESQSAPGIIGALHKPSLEAVVFSLPSLQTAVFHHVVEADDIKLALRLTEVVGEYCSSNATAQCTNAVLNLVYMNRPNGTGRNMYGV